MLSFLRKTLNQQNFVAGETPGFSDYIIFGAFQWARCISNFSLINTDDSIFDWCEKMFDLHNGLARNADVFLKEI